MFLLSVLRLFSGNEVMVLVYEETVLGVCLGFFKRKGLYIVKCFINENNSF